LIASASTRLTPFVDDAEPNVTGARAVGLIGIEHRSPSETRAALAEADPHLVTRNRNEHPMSTTPRTATVTAAARGIGAAVAKRLAADGFKVAVIDLDAAACAPVVDAITSADGTAIAVGANIADEQAVTAGVAEVAEKLGPPTVLVNNAGIIRDNLLFKMTADDWDTVMHVHLRDSFLMSRAAQQHMTAEKFGRIVNLSSASALGNRGQANYSAAKAGLQGFTKTLVLELGKFGVTANAIAPGFIETEMTAATAERIWIPFEEFKAGAAAQIAVGRVGQPEDIAHTVSFLVSEGAGFVTGQVIYVAGGPRC
jgi:3-oxoacyl-[acyl-carrier protein] reductase